MSGGSGLLPAQKNTVIFYITYPKLLSLKADS